MMTINNRKIIMQEGSYRIYQIAETIRRLNQTISYLSTFWPPNSIQSFKGSFELTQRDKNKQTSKPKRLSLSNRRSQPQLYKLIGNKMYFMGNTSTNEHVIKLKNVDNFLKVIDTNLVEVIQSLQIIHDKLLQYEDIQNIHNKYISQTKGRVNQQNIMRNSKQLAQHNHYNCMFQQSYDVETFNNIFKFINQFLFKDSFRDLIAKPSKQFAVWLLQLQTKLSILPELIESASKFTTDITTSQPTAEKYMYAWKNIQVVEMDDDKQKIKKQIDLLKRMMKITTSAVVAQNSSSISITKKIAFGLSFPYYWLADVQSQLKCYKIWRKPKIQVLNLVWNMPENGAISKLKSITFPYIKTSFFIYVPAVKQSQSKSKFSLNFTQSTPNIFQKSQNSEQTIRVLVLYHNRLPFQSESRSFEPFGCCTCFDTIQQDQIDTILIHIHGGGFVALSSQTSQTYTRKWANSLKLPVFSIDYRKPPNNRFPIPLRDCLVAYQFIVENIHKYFRIRPKNIVIAGDSAGGNLAVALEALLLQKNYPVKPLGIFLAYPAVDLRMRFSPSRLNSFDDPILLPPLLLLCLKQYLGQNIQNELNPLASPILLSQHFIQTGMNNITINTQKGKWPKQWPTTKIMVGKKDPLFDDSLRLLQKMTYSGVNANLIIYSQLSHAFLSLDNLIPACAQAIQDSISEIKKLFRM